MEFLRMKKLVPWLVILTLVMSSAACRLGFNLDALQDPDPTPRPAVTEPVRVAPPTPTSPPSTPISVDLYEMEDLLITLYERTSPGVVAIQTLNQIGGGLGSGFVYDHEGHIITNYHVVEGAQDLEINFSSGLKVRGTVIGTDLDSDLAVIKVDAPPEELVPLPMGDSDLLRVGQSVIAIGNPFGLSGTMTIGIISAKGRTLDSFRQSSDGLFFSAGDLLQTDAAINPGNSGGPLLNLNGEVIGVNRAIRTIGMSDSGDPINSGIGFAISINIIKRVVPSLIATGTYDYPYLGITARPELTLLEQEILGLPRSTGAYIIAITPGSPAEDAGLRDGSRRTEQPGLFSGGDLITAVDGRPVQVFGDLLSYLMVNKSPGDTILLTIFRDNEEKEVNLTLGKRP
jgi:S1-C subfamily serine protease